MSNIILIGLNHKTAPVEIRECIAFSEEETARALTQLRNQPAIGEVLLLSTCNRVEVLMVSDHKEQAIDVAKTFLATHNDVTVDTFEEALYIHEGDKAVQHLFRVAASLDSMIVGEPQILGQIKSAYHTAVENNTSGVILNRLLHRTFFVAKRIRSETGIGDHAVSISYAAIELGRKIFGSLENKKVLLIGAGEMAELAVEHLIRHRCDQIWVANRTFARGVELAQRFNGQAIRFEEIIEYLKQADIVISSTGSADYVLKRAHLKGITRSRRNRPLFFIDIAVPRDIEPDINRLTNTYLYDIDDLQGIVDGNVENRQKEAIKGERIVDEAVIRFGQWLDELEIVPTIKALRTKLNLIADTELRKTLLNRSITDEEIEAVRRMTQAIINKILHDPTDVLKRNGCRGATSEYLDVTRKLFRLDEDG